MAMRVLVAYHFFPHYRLPILEELSRDDEISYTFISGTTTDTEIKIIDPGVMAEKGIHWKRITNIWLFRRKILWQIGLISECVLGGYDAIVFLASPYFVSTWPAMLFSRLLGKKVFLWAHAILRSQKMDFLKVIFYRLANGLLLYGNAVKPNLQRHGLADENLFVVYNSLDYGTQLSLREQLEPHSLVKKKKDLFTHPENPVLLFIGRFTPVKKLDELILACEKIHGRGLQVNLLFIGEGSEKERLALITEERQLQEYVVFFGECYDEKELATLIALADVCVSPGNVGLTAIHALTYGTPVITHNNPLEQMPEFEAIAHGETGMFFEQGSIDSLTDTIFNWLQHNKSNREQLRDKCYGIIDKYYNPAFQAKIIRTAIMEYHTSRGSDHAR